MQQADFFRIAALQASSVFLDIEASVEKACRLIREAAAEGHGSLSLPAAQRDSPTGRRNTLGSPV